MNTPVLVLNFNYEPLNVCDTRRALVLTVVGRASVIENGRGEIRTATAVFPRPAVIRLRHLVRRPRPRVRLVRREVFRRDNFTCQYCGESVRPLTLDHVVPRHRGGRHTWTNIVTACPVCNRRKGGRTPEEAGMQLLHVPFEPKSAGYQLFSPHLREHAEWSKFLEGWL